MKKRGPSQQQPDMNKQEQQGLSDGGGDTVEQLTGPVIAQLERDDRFLDYRGSAIQNRTVYGLENNQHIPQQYPDLRICKSEIPL